MVGKTEARDNSSTPRFLHGKPAPSGTRTPAGLGEITTVKYRVIQYSTPGRVPAGRHG